MTTIAAAASSSSSNGYDTANGSYGNNEAGPSSSSKIASGTEMRPDLAASAAQVKDLLSSSHFDDVRSLIESFTHESALDKERSRETFLSHAPTFLSLHSELDSSIASLDTLSEFLTTFSNDLGSVSVQIASLKEKSKRIDEELTTKRALEEPLGRLLNGGLVLNPKTVEKIFDSEPDRTWVAVVKELEATIEATRKPLDELAATAAPTASTSGARSRAPSLLRRSSARGSSLPTAHEGAELSVEDESTFKALHEAREVAETCKNVAAAKIRDHLVKPFALMKLSVTTNVQILQTSILLPQHQPLYAFLARQMPRVAIDVQRAYIAAARLYFETGFRRYARSLNVLRKRGYDGGGEGSIVDAFSSGGFGAFLGAGGADGKRRDQWMTDPNRLEHANFDGPPVTLGFLSDDAKHKEPPEALYRSLALVFFDNACSEYTFIVRYFESLQSVTSASSTNHRRSRSGSTMLSRIEADMHSPPAISEVSDEDDEDADDTLAPSESASVAGGPSVRISSSTEAQKGDLVQLSSSEQAALKGRGAADEIFKKVFEPVTGTWLSFSRSLLTPGSPLPMLSLLCMIQLTDQLLSLSSIRGSASVLTGPLLQFKMEAWPLFQKRFQEEIDAVLRLAGEAVAGSGGSSSGASAAAGLGGWMRSAAAGVGALGGSGRTQVDEAGILVIVSRYTSLFSQIAYLSSRSRLPDASSGQGHGHGQGQAMHSMSSAMMSPSPSQQGGESGTSGGGGGGGVTAEDSSALMLFSSLLRLRNALDKLIDKKCSELKRSSKEVEARRLRSDLGQRARSGLEGGPAAMSLPRMQKEASHWVEVSRKA